MLVVRFLFGGIFSSLMTKLGKNKQTESIKQVKNSTVLVEQALYFLLSEYIFQMGHAVDEEDVGFAHEVVPHEST